MRPFNTSHGGRRGNVTIIVVAFLALFLVLGLTFAFYSIGEADQAKVYRDASNGGQTGVWPTTHDGAPPEPDTLFNIVMSNVVYGPQTSSLVNGPQAGLPGAFNAFRGHDISRLIYGWNPADPSGATQPYNGIGYVPPQIVHPVFTQAGLPQLPTDANGNVNVVNWSWAYALSAIDPRMGYMYDPDNNWEINPKANTDSPLSPPTNDPRTGAATTYRYYAKNANYTYPDVNNMFLAAMDPTTGRVLVPSYYRPWLMTYTDPTSGKQTNLPPSTSDGSGNPQFAIDPSTGAEPATGISARMPFPSNSPNNVANPITWMNAYGRLQLLRPRPVDNMVNVGGVWLSYFPYPKVNSDGTIGDVENIEGKPGGRQYDALWMDPDLPVRRWQGKNYKPLVALTIVDLDSRVNVNVAGNFFPLPDETTATAAGNQQPPANPPTIRQFVPPQYGHYSNMGVGMWEQNLAKVVRAYPQMTGVPAPGVTPISLGITTNPPNAQWDSNDAAYITRPKLAWKGAGDPPPPPMWKFAAPDVHNRFGWNGVNDGVPNRKFYTYSNEFNLNPAAGTVVPPRNQPSPGNGAPFYGPVDFNGVSLLGISGFLVNYQPTQWGTASLPGTNHTTNVIFANPYLNAAGANAAQPDPNSRYDNGLYIVGASGVQYDERTNHPMMYNPFWVKPRTLSSPGGLDRDYGPEEMRFLNEKFNYVNTAPSMLAKLAPNSLGQSYSQAGTLNPRFAITTLSQDINAPGASPWLGGGPPNLMRADGKTFTGTTGQYPTWQPQPVNVTASNLPAPGVGLPAGAPPPDYDPFYRANLVSMLGPVDLNRKLTDYRTVTSAPLSPTNVGNYQRALQDRQDLARDIFNRLRYVTTGELPNTQIPGTAGGTDPTYDARRWLAQLAVNIVDFIDNDDISTAFNWNPAQIGSVTNGWVYGVERPRLEMNETYTRIENNPKDPFQPSTTYPPDMQATMPFSLRCWIELHNPLTPGSQGEQNYDPTGDATATDPTHGGYRTNLTENVYANPASPSGQPQAQTAYRILIYQQPAGQNLNMKMDQPDTVTGLPQPQVAQPAGWPKVVDFTSAGGTQSAPNGTTVFPNIGAQFQNQGQNKTFFVLGPTDDATGGNDAKLPDGSYTADLTHKALSIEMDDKNNNLGNNQDVNEVPDPNNPLKMVIRPAWVPFFVLQRLSNPYIPYSGTPTQATLGQDPTNQYVTIDYISPDNSQNPLAQSVYDHIQWTGNGDRGTAANATSTQPDLNTTYAWGRRQPYDATINWKENAAPYKYRQGAGGAAAGAIGGQTFGKHNGMNGNWPQPAQPGTYTKSNESPGTQTNDTLQVPFTPLNHLDRVLISPTELLHVAATKPHELTQQFYMAGDGNFRRLAYTANWLDNPDSTNLPQGAQQSTLLFRAFDFLRAGPFAEGIPTGGRIAGKINFNTIHNLTMTPDPTTGQVYHQFAAVADPQQANRFSQTDMVNAWQGFVNAANGLYPNNTRTAGGIPFVNGNDKYLKGSAIDVAVASSQPAPGDGQDLTLARRGGLWRPAQAGQLAAQPDEGYAPANNMFGPMQKYELMSKTYQQFTTRSNCFAVYATIGYFEVVNDGPYDEINRPVLGKELGTDDGTVTRNKFFAVIDRTNLTLEPTTGLQGSPPVYFTYEPDVLLPNGIAPGGFTVMPDPDLVPANAPAMTAVQCRIPAVSQTFGVSPPYPANKTVQLGGYYDGTQWSIIDTSPVSNQGVTLAMLDTGPKAEIVQILFPQTQPALDNLGAATIILKPVNAAGTFQFRHYRGAPLRLLASDPSQAAMTPGNPGPQAGFNYHTGRYAPVVRYAEQLR